MTDLLQGIIDSGFPVKAIPVKGQWIEIDTFKDLRIAERLLLEGRLTLQ
jgi:NDP-sugar pyrophosphorylase family protein